jgi:integrase
LVKITNPNHRVGKPVSEFVINNFALDRKIKEACTGLLPTYQWMIMELESDEDKELVADFILNWSNDSKNGTPMPPNTKASYIAALTILSKYIKNKRNGGVYKPFRNITRDDFFADQEPKGYLRSLKRELEDDPDQKWASTHNTRGAKYLPFWKWLTQPDLPREERQTPPQLKGYRRVKRKVKTNVKREHHWTPQEHVVFLKYCEDLRIVCFHTIHMETGARPDELLELKLGDIKIVTEPSTGKKKCEFWIGKKGKTENSYRPATITDAIPYFNVWAHIHPARDWSEKQKKSAYIFVSREHESMHSNKRLKVESLRLRYVEIIERQFPKLLDRPDIPLEDKVALRSLIYDKPHYPYLRRHEFATEIGPRASRQSFNQLLGHSPRSNLQDVYVQASGNEGVRELEIARGVRTREDMLTPAQIEMQPKYCWACGESNKHNAKFCFKCNVAISKEGMLEDKEKEAQAQRKAENVEKELVELKTQQQEFEEKVEETMAANFQKMQQEMLRMFGPSLKKIKNQKERNNEMSALLVNADVLDEYDI